MFGEIEINFVASYCAHVISMLGFLDGYLAVWIDWESWYFETVETQEVDLSLRSEGLRWWAMWETSTVKIWLWINCESESMLQVESSRQAAVFLLSMRSFALKFILSWQGPAYLENVINLVSYGIVSSYGIYGMENWLKSSKSSSIFTPYYSFLLVDDGLKFSSESKAVMMSIRTFILFSTCSFIS